MIELLEDWSALERIGGAEIEALADAAAEATFYVEDLTPEQVAANRRIVAISAERALLAIASPNQRFAAAFVGATSAGYVISTIHAPDDRELDWMMVHPEFHGTGVASALMGRAIVWLGRDKPIWLNVIQHNTRAIRFYRRFGFEIDPSARTNHVVPHYIMRRPAPRG